MGKKRLGNSIFPHASSHSSSCLLGLSPSVAQSNLFHVLKPPVSCKCSGREGLDSVCSVHLGCSPVALKAAGTRQVLVAIYKLSFLLSCCWKEGFPRTAHLSLSVFYIFTNLDVYVAPLPREKHPTEGLYTLLLAKGLLVKPATQITLRNVVHLCSSMNLLLQTFPTPPDIQPGLPYRCLV